MEPTNPPAPTSAVPSPAPCNESQIARLTKLGTGTVHTLDSWPAYQFGLLGGLEKALPGDTKIFSPPIRSTSVKELDYCKRLFFFRQRLGLVPKSYYSKALSTGSFFHEILEACIHSNDPHEMVKHEYARMSKSNDVLDEINALRDGLAAKGAAWQDAVLPDYANPDKLEEDMRIDLAKAAGMVNALLTYKDYLPHFSDVLDAEETFLVRVRGIANPLRGALDVVTYHTDGQSGSIWIYDYKTTSEVPLTLAQTLTYDMQTLLYYPLAAAKYSHLPIKGIIYLIVKKPGIKYCPNTKDKAGIGSYFQRVTEWYESLIKEAEFDSKKQPVVQAKVDFHQTKLAPATLQALRETGSASRCVPHLDRFPRAPSKHTCMGLYGKPCPFLQLCHQSSPAQWPSLLHNFNVVDPSEDLKEKPTVKEKKP